MPLSPLGPLPQTNPLLSLSIQQFIDVLTGAMTDQSITIANTLTVTNAITASSNVTFSASSSGGVLTAGVAGLIGTVAPGASGNVLTSSGGVWASVAAATVSSSQFIKYQNAADQGLLFQQVASGSITTNSSFGASWFGSATVSWPATFANIPVVVGGNEANSAGLTWASLAGPNGSKTTVAIQLIGGSSNSVGTMEAWGLG